MEQVRPPLYLMDDDDEDELGIIISLNSAVDR